MHSCFRNIGAKLLFRSGAPLNASNFRDRLATAPIIGRLVKKITVDIKDLGSSLDGPFSAVVECLACLDELTLIYDKDDAQARPELVKSLCRLGSITTLRVEEAGLDMTKVPAFDEEARSCHFVDYMLNSLLSSGSMSIRSFAHLGSTSLHSTVFHNLRTQPTHLRTLVLRSSIQYGLRERFNEPTRWSSAATLEELVIRACSGTHYATIALHVTSGVFGNLRRLVIIGSGYIDDNLSALPRPRISIRVLDLLEIDHATDWEVLVLAVIPAREVHLTRVFSHAIVKALTQGGWPGLEIVKVQNWTEEEDALIPEFRNACADRHAQLRVGAIPHGPCICHKEWVTGTDDINIRH